jgi:hypothetical protein
MNPGKLYMVKTACWLVFPTLTAVASMRSRGGTSSTAGVDAAWSSSYWETVLLCKLCFLTPTDSFVLLEEEHRSDVVVYKILTSDGVVGWIIDASPRTGSISFDTADLVGSEQ